MNTCPRYWEFAVVYLLWYIYYQISQSKFDIAEIKIRVVGKILKYLWKFGKGKHVLKHYHGSFLHLILFILYLWTSYSPLFSPQGIWSPIASKIHVLRLLLPEKDSLVLCSRLKNLVKVCKWLNLIRCTALTHVNVISNMWLTWLAQLGSNYASCWTKELECCQYRKSLLEPNNMYWNQY